MRIPFPRFLTNRTARSAGRLRAKQISDVTLHLESLEPRQLLAATLVNEAALRELQSPAQTSSSYLQDTSIQSTLQVGPVESSLFFLRENAAALGLTPAAFDQTRITDQYTSAHNGVTHIYLQQTYQGLDIDGAVLNVNLLPSGTLLNAGSSFVSIGTVANTPADSEHTPGIDPATAIELFRGHLLAATELTAPQFDELTAPIQLPLDEHFVAIDSGELRRAWSIEIHDTDQFTIFRGSIDQQSGEVLAWHDLKHHLASYEVFAQPLSGPDEGERTIVIDPADPDASPFGWHDTNGVTGAEFTTTRGNNARVQDDFDGNNLGGQLADGGNDLQFEFPLDFGEPTATNISASLTNAFYWTNVSHDIHYQYGFDEVAGNFQVNNYGNGGRSGDPIIVDVQDGGNRNNASFTITADGTSPRLQLHLFDVGPHVQINSANNDLAGQLSGRLAQFGPLLTETGLTGDLALAEDHLACEPLTNPEEIAGKIAVIDRGECNFTVKVKNAQDAGAIGVIVINNVDTGLITMVGEDPSITIPSMFVTLADGNRIKEAMSAGNVNVSLKIADESTARDSGFDSHIITHEYGHGVSSRLTGGPSQAFGLDGLESRGLGEGWSDWWSLMFTQEESDQATDAFPLADYSIANGGLRTFPYSFDMEQNPLAYIDFIERSDSEHAVGEIWASVLWDLNWLLINGDGETIDGYGFDPDLYDGSGGNNIAMQLVIDGLKLQPSEPTMINAREAILLADQVNNGGANQEAIWKAFARRGLGINASDGGHHNSLAKIENFDTPIFTVDSLADESDGDFSTGEFTLREAVERANSDFGHQYIRFRGEALAGTIQLNSPLAITDDLTISGPGGDELVIRANDGSRSFELLAGNDLTLRDFTVAGGENSGGGIESAGNLIVDNLILHDNHATGGAAAIGGAVAITGGSATISGTTFSGNTSTGRGGAVAIVDNAAQVTMIDSLFQGNEGASGGAIFNEGNLQLVSTTLSHNISSTSAAGIVNIGATSLENVTLVGAQADELITSSGQLNSQSSLFQGLVSASITGSYNLFRDNGVSTNGVLNLQGVDLKLGPLADNGGATLTHALLPGSPAIDAGDPTVTQALDRFDQRGTPYARVADGGTTLRIDAGAYEAQATPSAIPGDYSRDGTVNLADYTLWRDQLGTNVARLQATDGDGDGLVTQSDYRVWKSHFGFTDFSPSTATLSEADVGSDDIASLAPLIPRDSLRATSRRGVVERRTAPRPTSPTRPHLLTQNDKLLLHIDTAIESAGESAAEIVATTDDAKLADSSGHPTRLRDQVLQRIFGDWP